MSTIETQLSSAFSHSNLIKVGSFCQYIIDNWTAETGLILTNFALESDEKLTHQAKQLKSNLLDTLTPSKTK